MMYHKNIYIILNINIRNIQRKLLKLKKFVIILLFSQLESNYKVSKQLILGEKNKIMVTN